MNGVDQGRRAYYLKVAIILSKFSANQREIRKKHERSYRFTSLEIIIVARFMRINSAKRISAQIVDS